MSSFKDKAGQEWSVSLDPVIADEIKRDHGISLTNLKVDPLLPVRNDENYPSILVAIMLTICRKQIEQKGLTREQFMENLPFPPDQQLRAIEEAIVDFFPSGRHSHVQEVLTSYAEMGTKTDELATAKMRGVIQNPLVMKKINEAADREIGIAIEKMNPDEPPGT